MQPRLAKVGHVALETPDLEESLWFFRDVVGLRETGREDGVAYLRGERDVEHHTLRLIEADETRVDHVGWRTHEPGDVDALAEQLRADGVEVERVPPREDAGQGEAIRFTPPMADHPFEVYHDVEKPRAPAERRSRLRNRNYALSGSTRIRPLHVDHVAVGTGRPDAYTRWFVDDLGFRNNEYLEREDGSVQASWLSVTSQSHDVAVVSSDRSTASGFHHVAYYVNHVQELLDAADVLREEGVAIDGGPGRHGITQAEFLYVKDPGSGHRLELYTGAYHVFDPTWEPIPWPVDELEDALLWYGTRPGSDLTPF